jgi:hypothetical protein
LGSRPGQACSGSDPRLYDPRATVLVDGVEVGLRKNINLIPDGSVTIDGVDVPETDTVDITISATGGGGSIQVEDALGNVYTRPKILFTKVGALTCNVVDDVPNNKVNVSYSFIKSTAESALSSTLVATDKLPYYDSSSTANTTTLTSFGRSLLDDADAAAARTTLGISGIGVTDGDKGDILVSSSGTVWNIDATGTRDNSTFLRGDSTWSHVEVTRFPVKNTSGATLPIGTPVYATGSVGASGATEVAGADAGDAAKMPAIGVLEQSLANNAEGFAVPLGMVRGLDTSAYSMNGVVYVAVGGGLTTTRPTGATQLVQNIGRVVRVHASTGEILVMGPGRTNDVQNLIPTSRLASSGTASSSTYLRGDQTWATIPGASGSQSVTTIDFGAFPGSSDASLAITGQTGIDSASVVTAWLQPADTDDHTADEHRLETISVMAGNVIPGVGFTIYATNNSQRNEPLSKPAIDRFRSAATTVYGYAGESVGGRGTMIYGKWSVAWKWS